MLVNVENKMLAKTIAKKKESKWTKWKKLLIAIFKYLLNRICDPNDIQQLLIWVAVNIIYN